MSLVARGRMLSPRRVRAIAVATATAGIVTAANASQGAYFSQSWGWVALAFLVPTTLVLILDQAEMPGRLRIALVVAMFALAAWIALSAVWSMSSSGSLREVERMLVYVALALAVAFFLRRGDGPGVLAGSLIGITLVSCYGLATRLFPGRFVTYDDPHSTYRLSEPLGYYNALGLLAAMGLLVAFGLIAHARQPRAAIAAGAAAPVLSVTLYFTFSRGAWAALAVGLVGAVAFDRRRIGLLWSLFVVCPASVVAASVASQQDALTTEHSPVAEAVQEGRRLLVVLLLLTACSMLLSWGARLAAARVSVSARMNRSVGVILALGLAVGVLGALVAIGGPSRGVTALETRFDAEPVWAPNLNTRLLSVSGNGRSELLRIGWDVAREEPLIGSGAGTFEYVWYERRPNQRIRRDGHSLYLETLAELGIVGLSLLGCALAVLAVGLVASRRSRYAPAAAGAYVAWLSASALDWHWEMVGVTMTALLAGSIGPLVLERGRREPLDSRVRVAAASFGVVLSVLAIVSLVGNQALFAGRDALARKDWASAEEDAARARALLPWSFEPDLVFGDAAAGLGSREDALHAYRDAVAADPRNWVAWLRLAQVARGGERIRAYGEVHALNPREVNLPGEKASVSD